MQYKRIFLGIAAIIVGIAGSFAMDDHAHTAYVSILPLGNSNYICVNTGLQCDEFGPLTCKIDVLTVLGTTTVVARRDAACAATLNSGTNFSIGLYSPAYGLLLGAK